MQVQSLCLFALALARPKMKTIFTSEMIETVLHVLWESGAVETSCGWD